ncbi:MAG: CRISPR system precrRNA processing endoribonuclease RAMP protein Cas6 [Myxococcota bacterium]
MRAGCGRHGHGVEGPCREPGRCVYGLLLDTPVPEDSPHRLLQGRGRAPKALVPRYPRLRDKGLWDGERLELSFRLLRSLEPDPTERLRGALAHVADLPLGRDEGRVVLDDVAVEPTQGLPVSDGAPGQGRLRVDLLTPTELYRSGRKELVTDLDFPELVRHARRRLELLAAMYGSTDGASMPDWPVLQDLAGSVRVTRSDLRPHAWKRHSLERDATVPMRGLLGRIDFEGPVGPFLPLLRAAQTVHLGKSTSFGLGRFRLHATME